MAATFSPPSLVAQRPVSPKSKQTIDGTRLRRTSLCEQIAPQWNDLTTAIAPSGIQIYEMDCNTNEYKKACGKEGVKAYPFAVVHRLHSSQFLS
ncbi:hypothetical protein NBRC10513_008234 [Rhodotorula toruloides]